MFDVTRVVHFDDAADASDRAGYIEDVRIAAKQCGAVRHLVAPTLPGVINGGDLLIHLQFDSELAASRPVSELDALLDGPITIRVDGVRYHADRAGIRPGGHSGSIYRALLMRVAPGTPAATVARFERDLLRMPEYIPSIVAWRLSRVERAEGPTGWTHVWEQEFTDHASLIGQYLDHPIHWGVVDRWFDPECTEIVIRDRVCHTFCTIDDAVLR
ncbi:stress responsive protein [Rhodococcus aetherivorans]|nr:stress responsive protein [Rhodococcus aetherivorans]